MTHVANTKFLEVLEVIEMDQQDVNDLSEGKAISHSIFANIHGAVAGQVIAGNNNTQIVQNTPSNASFSEHEREILSEEFSALRTLIDLEVHPDSKDSAIERASELERALLEGPADSKMLTKMEYIRDWFVDNLPGIAGMVGGLVVHPLVGRLVEAGGDALVSEFKRRIAT
jgi:hypothetical protein